MSISLSTLVTFDDDTTPTDLDGVILFYDPGAVQSNPFLRLPDTLFATDANGNVIWSGITIDNALQDDPWHVRDDGNGAFTMYFLDAPFGGRDGGTRSISADGTADVAGTYEQRTLVFEINGVVLFEQTITEVGIKAVDLANGGIVTVADNADASTAYEDYSLIYYAADGTIDTLVDFTVTTAPQSASAAGLPDFEIVRSGDTIALFHQYRKGTGADTAQGDDQEIFMRTFDLSGNEVMAETRITGGDLEQGGLGFFAGNFEVETLRDGRIAIAYRVQKDGVADGATPAITSDANAQHDVFLQIRNPDGTVAVAEHLVNTEYQPGSQSGIKIHPLQDGSFALTFDTNYVNAGATIFQNTGIIQLYDANGAKVGTNQELLARNEFAEQSVILEDGTGLFGAYGSFYPITIAVGAAIADVNAPQSPDLELIGTRDPDDLTGGVGNDTLVGRGSDDTLTGGEGDDNIKGGSGADTINGDAGEDTLLGGSGDDSILGGAGEDTLRGQGDDDYLNGGSNNDTLRGDSGNDTLLGATGTDNLIGSGGNDSLDGGNGDDRLNGGNDNDTLLGGAGADRLEGAGGMDRLDGEAGRDKLSGGNDSDTFVFDLGMERDRITDFDISSDRLEISTDLADGRDEADIAALARLSGGSYKIYFGDGDVIVLSGVSDVTGLAGQIDIV